ncbi:MAG: ABC transporter ATP-binding protein [Candidatus Marinimicrobia bacterium]|nr:ABC transporter ATP-binding protein [Candidatus Neomarinimicrobiota bacterium]
MLKLNNIESYYDLVLALRGVSMEVQEGTITTILGNNGAGKTTILKTIMGLLDDQPDKGTIEFNRNRIEGNDTEVIVRQGISYVPEGREIFEELTVGENLMMGAYIRSDSAAIKKDLSLMYEYFPVLSGRESQLAGTLSGGEQQMLAIGRALMNKPKLLFLDEPSLGLSPLMVKKIFEIIQTIKENGVTIVLVEQNARMALKYADYGYILENGRFVLDGPADKLMEDKDVQEFYLGQKQEQSLKGFQRWKRKKRWR